MPTLTIDYGYDTHSVEIDAETLAHIDAGEAVSFDGQGFAYEEEGTLVDHWSVDALSGAISVNLDNGAEFHARKFWIDR